MENLETKLQEPKKIVIIADDTRLIKYAIDQGMTFVVYTSESAYEDSVIFERSQRHSLGDFTRKSVVGAGYRVGASFTLDAIYLTAAGAIGYYMAKKAGLEESIAQSASDFVKNLDPAKLARVTVAVVLINFADYALDITNRLDRGIRSIGRNIVNLVKSKKD
ncbi:MAG: hypothetical protein Q8L34_04335 [Candidatus Woesearchaeota archaeon]|nr:hypothetical protein [Candidatus Woesearchaeota archaeon]